MKKASSGSGGGGGGSSTILPFVGTVQNSVQIPTSDATTDTVFTDISDVKWAQPYITALYKEGIVSGKGESKYEPFSPLKREELAKLLSLGFNLDGNDEAFTDVSETDWFYPYVCALYSSGISNGLGDTSFGTGLNITRQDAAVMIARILEKEGLLTKSSDTKSFADDIDISAYAKDAVYSLRTMGIINGDDSGKFNPKSNITRAEIAKVIYLAIEQCE